MKKLLLFGLVLIALMAACAAPAPSQPVTSTAGTPVVTVYKSPT